MRQEAAIPHGTVTCACVLLRVRSGLCAHGSASARCSRPSAQLTAPAGATGTGKPGSQGAPVAWFAPLHDVTGGAHGGGRGAGWSLVPVWVPALAWSSAPGDGVAVSA